MSANNANVVLLSCDWVVDVFTSVATNSWTLYLQIDKISVLPFKFALLLMNLANVLLVVLFENWSIGCWNEKLLDVFTCLRKAYTSFAVWCGENFGYRIFLILEAPTTWGTRSWPCGRFSPPSTPAGATITTVALGTQSAQHFFTIGAFGELQSSVAWCCGEPQSSVAFSPLL